MGSAQQRHQPQVGWGVWWQHIKCTDISTLYKLDINHGIYAFKWLTWGVLIITPFLGLANNITLGFTLLAITTGFDHLNRNLAKILLVFELANLILYTTMSPT
jgi:hypothetical protein